MKRTVVLGTSGAGKSTLAAALAARDGVPHVDLDDLAAGNDFRRRVEEVVATEAWVVDGDYERALGDAVLARAERAIWLELPLRVSLARMTRRTARLLRDGEPAPSPRLLVWVGHEIRSHLRRKRTMRARLARHPQLEVVHLCSQAEVDGYRASSSAIASRRIVGNS